MQKPTLRQTLRAGFSRACDKLRAGAAQTCRGLAGTILLCGLGGCQIFSIAAYKMSGTAEVPAQYVPAQKPMLVLVEKSNNLGEVPLESGRIAHLIGAAFQEKHVAPLVEPSALAELRSRNPGKYSGLSTAEAGRLVHASQVLYVDIVDFTVEDAIATELVRGRAEARVRVIDVNTGQTLWPLDTTQGYPLSIDTPFGQSGAKQTPAPLREKLCTDLAGKVSRLFFKYRSDQASEDMNVSRAETIQ